MYRTVTPDTRIHINNGILIIDTGPDIPAPLPGMKISHGQFGWFTVAMPRGYLNPRIGVPLFVNVREMMSQVDSVLVEGLFYQRKPCIDLVGSSYYHAICNLTGYEIVSAAEMSREIYFYCGNFQTCVLFHLMTKSRNCLDLRL